MRALTETERYLCVRYNMDPAIITQIKPDHYYRAADIADILRVSYETIRRRIRDGAIPSTSTYNPAISGSALLEYIWSCLRAGRKI